ncbi:MAG: SMP-30/gluconolactonase/LRE family protein [Candidatus Rokubacteria bacterium]|nr:SMP-30/gluconolactonase/LRE family protein [Candidatus Rokubacteria bacterium]
MVRGREPRETRPEVSREFEKLGTGFLFTEGPVWHPVGKFLLFSDMPGDHMRRWSARDGVTTFRKPSSMANGNTYDRQGRLLTCEHATSRVTRTEPDGRIVPVVTHFRGKQLNSPNDIVCRSDGGIYFTDPPYGRLKFYGVERPQELDFQGVFRVGGDPGSPELLVDDFDRPNGLCFSLDESRLYINDTARKHIRVFDVAPNGTLRSGRVWAETKGDKPGAPDGMKIDAASTLYCTGPGGIHVFGPDASLREVIEVPEYTANFTWGDDDFRSLFITASTSLYRTRTTGPGRPVF